MGVLKRNVDSKAKGFTPYSGPDPKPGTYRARVVKGAIRAASTGTLSYNVLVEFVATKPEHKKYDGFDCFVELWLGEKEASQAKEAAFIKAITGKDNFKTVNVAYTGKEEDFNTPSGAEITGLDGVKLPNKIVNVYMRMEKASTGDDGKEYPARLRADSILPWTKDEDAADDDDTDQIEDGDVDEQEEDADLEDDGEDDGEEMSDEEWEAAKEARRTELKSRQYDLAKLRGVLKENGIDTKGLKKDDLVEAIIGLEFPEDGEESDEEIDENDVEVDEDAAESDAEESEEDEEEDDEEEEDEEEEEEEGDDLRTEIEAEAAGLDRSALKKAIKALDADAGFKKAETDDDLRERFVELKLAAPGF